MESDRTSAVLSAGIVTQLSAIEMEVARARGLAPSPGSSGRGALRSYLKQLAQSEAPTEARVTVHGPAHQALLVGLGERYGVPGAGVSAPTSARNDADALGSPHLHP